MIRRFDSDALPATRWKNGAGETREIISQPSPDAPFLWRASIASVSIDGPFSPFPGVDRVITLLNGAPFLLEGEDVSHRLALHQPWAFAGELAITAKGVSQPGLDFNVMTQRARAHSRVQILHDSHTLQQQGVCYVLAGRWLSPVGLLTVSSGVVWQTGATGEIVPQSDDAALLWAEVEIYP